MAAAVDESFKRPGSVPFKWEVQPGVPKQEQQVPPATTTTAPPRLALPPAASSSCRRASSWAAAAAPLSQPSPTHRRSVSARFATSLALPFTRRGRGGGGGGGRAGAGKDDDAVDYCLLYAENKVV